MSSRHEREMGLLCVFSRNSFIHTRDVGGLTFPSKIKRQKMETILTRCPAPMSLHCRSFWKPRHFNIKTLSPSLSSSPITSPSSFLYPRNLPLVLVLIFFLLILIMFPYLFFFYPLLAFTSLPSSLSSSLLLILNALRLS